MGYYFFTILTHSFSRAPLQHVGRVLTSLRSMTIPDGSMFATSSSTHDRAKEIESRFALSAGFGPVILAGDIFSVGETPTLAYSFERSNRGLSSTACDRHLCSKSHATQADRPQTL
jgi:hypothetical protein